MKRSVSAPSLLTDAVRAPRCALVYRSTSLRLLWWREAGCEGKHVNEDRPTYPLMAGIALCVVLGRQLVCIYEITFSLFPHGLTRPPPPPPPPRAPYVP